MINMQDDHIPLSSPISAFSSFLRPDPNRNNMFQYSFNDKKIHSKDGNKKKFPATYGEEGMVQNNQTENNLEAQKPVNNQNSQINNSGYEINGKNKITPIDSMSSESFSTFPGELLHFKDKFLLFISITMTSDNVAEIKKLQSTLKSIEQSMTQLHCNLGIAPGHILIFVFIENVLETKNIHYLFPGLSDDQITLEEESKRQLFNCNNLFYDFSFNSNYEGDQKTLTDHFNLVFIFKKDISKYEAHKVFLLGLCNDLKKPFETSSNEKNPANAFFTLFLNNGVTVEQTAISQMIIALTNTDETTTIDNFTLADNKTFCATGNLQSISPGKFKFYSSVQEYEFVHQSMFDNFYDDLSSKNEVDHRFSMLKITKNVFHQLLEYFNNPCDKDIYFHSQQVAHSIIYSETNKEDSKTIYLHSSEAYINSSDIGFAELMQDYTDRESAYIYSFFPIFASLFSCSNCSGSKVANLFLNMLRIFAIFVRFVLPGLFIFVIYSIFYEAFGKENIKATHFFTVLYCFLLLITVFYSLVATKVKDIAIFFHIIHYVFLIFYFFIIICGIVAVDHIRKLPSNNPGYTYQFNSGALAGILVINIIFTLALILINCSKYKSQLLNLIIFIFGGLTGYSSVFLFYSIFHVFKSDPKYKSNNLKSFFITAFILCNGFFGYLIFTLDRTDQRINSVLILAIIFTLYNCIKISLNIYNFIIYHCVRLNNYSKISNNEKIKNVISKFFNCSFKEIPENTPLNRNPNVEIKVADENTHPQRMVTKESRKENKDYDTPSQAGKSLRTRNYEISEDKNTSVKKDSVILGDKKNSDSNLNKNMGEDRSSNHDKDVKVNHSHMNEEKKKFHTEEEMLKEESKEHKEEVGREYAEEEEIDVQFEDS